ncbi:MAG: hypothetical protein KME60_07915 [Cyanomargarita calcarea GSE-NOS-MK-12-04C]|jgi:hypothetical protein|uniref:Uncharacterized protein n=1 Tax=Cyanomargarita calcarea GSE-NOS-MK-12-04C TaxID=2839659 RepID=A0A951URB7_9CYAN|nr:hypothetical protein [Cyanomargarita calcarea GSE-NOS-MK-12-04C]
MLVEKSQELIELSKYKKDLQKFANNLKTFQTRQKQINDAVVTIQPLVEALAAFRQRNIIDALSDNLTKRVDTLLAFIITAEEKFKNDPDWILDNTNFKENFLNINSLKALIDKLLTEAWKSYRDQEMPSTNSEILNVLSKVEAFKYTVQQIRNLDAEIKKIIYPQNNSQFTIYEQKIAQLKQSWDTLKSDDFPEAVLDFIRVTANQGTTLKLLTPEVQDWIIQHKIADNFKISLS